MTTPAKPGNAMRAGLLIAAVFLWLASTAWLRRFTAPDEGRYAGVALEMLRSGDWWVPRLNGLPFFHKPPLFYWIGAAAMSLFGANEWAARLPSLLGATVSAGALFLFARRWMDRSFAILSVVVLATMPFFYVAAQFANLDILVSGCITATVLLIAHSTLAREQGEAWHAALIGAFAFAALSVLAKGLIGFLLPGAIFVLWCLVTRRARAILLLFWWPGWCVFLAIGAPWFVVMQWRYPGFYDYFVVTQHFRRFASAGFNNAQPFWFYVPVIVGLTLPWSPWLARLWTRAPAPRRRLTDVDWLMLLWLIVVLVFFSIPRSKLIGYVLPTLPSLAWFVARALQSDRLSRKSQCTGWGAAVLCVAAVLAAGHFATPPGARLPLPAEAKIAADDQVVMLDAYYYEIPFYWKLTKPVIVVSHWDDPALASRDDWRKELSDAGTFEPRHAEEWLVRPEDLPRTLCAVHPTWLVGSSAAVLLNPWLADPRFVLVTHNVQMAVWRFAGGDADLSRCVQSIVTNSRPPGSPP
jgi:4-amino-4-deoxy-L-arabinose transferase-like glycosyltransferase